MSLTELCLELSVPRWSIMIHNMVGILGKLARSRLAQIRWLVFEFARERKPDKWLVFEFARKRKPVRWLAFEFARGRGMRASHASETHLRNWGWTHFGGVQRGRLWVNPVQANARPEISLILRQYTEKYFLTTQFSYGKFNDVKKIWFCGGIKVPTTYSLNIMEYKNRVYFSWFFQHYTIT